MKMNKKGFTLAELLIVIAIIAILIAIAIPAFSASLRSARLQTDHANIRSAYTLYRTGEMLGTIGINDTATWTYDGNENQTAYFVFQKDGTMNKVDVKPTAPAGNDYVTQLAAKSDECAASVGCGQNGHKKGACIVVSCVNGTWSFELIGGSDS